MHRCSSVNFEKIVKAAFYKTPPVAAPDYLIVKIDTKNVLVHRCLLKMKKKNKNKNKKKQNKQCKENNFEICEQQNLIKAGILLRSLKEKLD